MFPTVIYPLFACFSSTLFANPVQAVNGQTLERNLGNLRPPSRASDLPLASNTTLSLLNPSGSNSLSIECDGDKYGFRPDVDDCTDALGRQIVGGIPVTFGQRGGATPGNFLPLPYRLMGGMYLFISGASYVYCYGQRSS